MIILFLRSVILYLLLFTVIRLTGKRQLSDLQPFDLIITLLIADLASQPAADTGIPLLYGVVPILALFLIQQLLSFSSLKSERLRCLICGRPVIVVEHGTVVEHALRASRYTLDDLMEQLRAKDVFSIDKVAFAVLETNGSLSVLLAGREQQPTYKDMKLSPPRALPPFQLVHDGKVHRTELYRSGYDEAWLTEQLARCKVSPNAVLFAFLTEENRLHVQTKQRAGGKVFMLDVAGQSR